MNQASASETSDEATSAEQLQEEFLDTWNEPTGFPAGLATVDNIRIAVSYMVTAFNFFLIGGVFALLMRIQLAVPDNDFMGPEVYNRMFTMHGTTMMYLFAVPFQEGMAAMLLPFMIGTRDLAYPRLTALSYWTFLFSGLIFYGGFLLDQVADIGWFAYTPLSAPAFANKGIDFWLVGLGAAELAGIAAGAELTVSVLWLRAPGMSLNRMPVYAWAWLVTALMIVFAFTTLLVATMLLEFDQALSTHFFNDKEGGNHLLWQHLFWFFGHPEVYIIFLPATGVVSMIISAFSRRLHGYTFILVAILLTAFLSFGLWVHHMYTTGMPELSLYFFAGASLMIALASGVQIFAWISSLWGRRPAMQTPLLYVLGFMFIFVLGGLTGVMVAIVPFDWQVHDTFFLVAHFHYVLIGGALFPIMGGLYYWMPKFTGKLLNETLGKWEFGLNFIGFNLTFFPMHIMGLLGMPRRVYTFEAGMGLEIYNLIATGGSFMLAAGFALFIFNVIYSLRYGPQAMNNPWGSDSLEWSFESPPPAALYPRQPVVTGRHPLWDDADEYPENPQTDYERLAALLAYRPSKWRATLLTDLITGRPLGFVRLAKPSHMPLLVAAGIMVMTVAIIGKAYWVVAIGAAMSVGGLIYWLWPDRKELELIRRSTLPAETGLPIMLSGTKSLGWLGLMFLLLVLGWVFTTFYYTYFYLRLYSQQWPQEGLPDPDWLLPAIAYSLLLAGVVAAGWSLWSFRKDQKGQCQIALGLASLLLLSFFGVHVYDQVSLDFRPHTNAYGSIFFVIGWGVDLLSLMGALFAITALIRAWQHTDDWQFFLALHTEITAHFSYFMGVIAVLSFGVLYVSPYVL